MNRDELLAKWDSMTPRERDAWVAEVVFGWAADDIEDSLSAWEIGVSGSGIRVLPYYSTDISAAWAVVEKFDKNTFNLNWLDGHNHYGEGWHCKLDDAHAHKCGTAPEAICKAALLSLISEETL